MAGGDGLTWGVSSATVDVGETVTVNVTYGSAPTSAGITNRLNNLATATLSSSTVVFTGVSAGTVTISSGTNIGNACYTNNSFTLTVTAPAEDESYLNKRGLTHFWENIDDIKQDKLTAGANITIAADNTISASQPTVNNATLTIQRNGTSVGTFTANASSNVTANISVPTKTSDLTNDGSDNTAQYLETDETAYKTASIPYGECDSTSTSTVFTATVPGITELRDGVCMLLKNGVVTSASGFTININGLGAKPAYSNMAAATRETTIFNINYTILFIYDSDRVEGGCWVYYRGYFSDANSVGYQIRTNSSTLPALQTGYRYRLWLTSADGQNYVPINTSSSTSATTTKALNTTTPIDPFGTIVYNATNGAVEAGASLAAGSQWTQFTVDMRQVKYPLTLTFPDPVYLQCTPQASGNGALINDIVQALPTTEDGKIYIYLGNAYSATSMELKQNHPVYYFKDGQIRLWTNAAATGGGGPTVVQTTGQSTTDVMSQKAVTDELALKADASSLATVATSGSYNDLSNKPTIPAAQVNSDWSANSGVAQILNKPTLATVATSGSYNDLTDKPVITDENYLITATSFSGSDGAYTFTADRTYAEIEAAYRAGKHLIVCADIYRVPDSGRPSTAHEYLYAELSRAEDSGGNDGPTFAFLATTASGSGRSITIWSHNFYIYGYAGDPYNAYSVDNASITVTDIISNSQNPISSNAVYTALATKANTSSLSTVATSGSYNDLSNKPTVPEIKKRTGASTTTNITPLYVAGDGTTTTPMALKTHGDTRNGSFAYININEPTNAITEAYAGGYVWDEDEDWWRKMSEVRLALYSDIPTVPTVNNATLTIQKNGTNVATFTANASSNVTANISVPTLYTTTGQNEDGAVTQKLFTDTVGNVETILQTLNNGGGAQ